MLLYRITRDTYAYDLMATGCLYGNGRWHRRGTRVLYTSEHVSLAKLEVLANSLILPKNQVLVTIEVPNDATIQLLTPNLLPQDWWNFPYPDALADYTEEWIRAGDSWILKVPSAQSTTEYNYLLNPLHPQHNLAKVVGVEPVQFDKRLK
ncbi:RES family NAD+ phosphorylase [Telluribacter sp. SYSU D00476]|uniref:RES family NAD+ phosphorylase n=1 Tax=Telluribacter sp. SYSU D00476 TaxID=2811430 RepID=UPI001FF55659|nr:RES family NAD+ phosphorylase [Telluribacter sp. SYSU D00476]